MDRAVAIILAAALFAVPAKAQPSVSAKSMILMDADTGAILCSQNMEQRSLIASTTKIMTAIVAIEQCDLDRSIEIPKEAVGIEGSSLYLQEGETMTIHELLYGLMLHSGNDAAVAIAIACAGSKEAFVCKMNELARRLELENTHFENPNGLDGKEHYSTALDLAKLTQYGLKNPVFADIVATKEIRIGERFLHNHNRLLWMSEDVVGVKTGYTRAAGRILVSAAKKNGRSLIAVTICDGNDWNDHLALYEYGFSRYEEKIIVREGQPVLEMELPDGQKRKLLSSVELRAHISSEESVCVEPVYPRIPIAPCGIALADVYIGSLYVTRIVVLWEETNEGTITENHCCTWSLLPQNRRGLDQPGTGHRQWNSRFLG